MDDDILNCPFCGGSVEIAGVGRVYIRCRLCRSRGKTYHFRWFNEDSYIEAEDRDDPWDIIRRNGGRIR